MKTLQRTFTIIKPDAVGQTPSETLSSSLKTMAFAFSP